jgi:hypothetical protein
MTQASNILQSTRQNFLPAFADKAYGLQQSETKQLGGVNPELVQWYEEALPYWQAYQRGEVKISTGEAQQLAQWIQWAESQLRQSSTAWGEPGDGTESASRSGKGAMENATYTKDQNILTVDGKVAVSDVWGSTATLNVPPPCSVLFETTTDSRFNPAETVVKAVVTNPALRAPNGQGARSVVFFHDGVKISCNASKTGNGESRVTDGTGTVVVGEFKEGGKQGAKPESSIKGDYDAETNTYSYDGTGQDAVKFSPVGDGQDGEVTTHLCECNSDITVKNTDRVYAYRQDGKFVYDVLHKNGSVDRFVAGPEYSVNLNGIASHIFIGSNAQHMGGSNPTESADGDKVQMDEFFAKNLTINWLDSEGVGIVNVHPEDNTWTGKALQ